MPWATGRMISVNVTPQSNSLSEPTNNHSITCWESGCLYLTYLEKEKARIRATDRSPFPKNRDIKAWRFISKLFYFATDLYFWSHHSQILHTQILMLPLDSLAPSQGREKLQGQNLRQTSYLKCLCRFILSLQTIQPINILLLSATQCFIFLSGISIFWTTEVSKSRAQETQSSSCSGSDPAITAHLTASVHLTARCSYLRNCRAGLGAYPVWPAGCVVLHAPLGCRRNSASSL